VRRRPAAVYVCDGAELAEWFSGAIVLADATQRGAVRTITAVVANPFIDPDPDLFIDPEPDF